MSGVGVVLNPKSRKNLRDPKAASRLARILGDRGVVREARSIDELHRIAEDFRRLAIDVLAISGGDGTNHVTLTGFVKAYGDAALPAVAMLRGGTMNTVAKAVGTRRGTPDALLAKLARAYDARASKPLVYVERHLLRAGEHYGFLFGTGVVRGFLGEYYRFEDRSPLVAARTFARLVGSALVGGETIRRAARPFHGSVTLEDGTRWEERDYLTVTAGTIDDMGLGFRPFYRYAERPESFHLLGIFAPASRVAAELPRIWRAQPMRAGTTYEATPSSAVLHSGQQPLQYMIDGDLHETTGSLSLGVGPRLRIVHLG